MPSGRRPDNSDTVPAYDGKALGSVFFLNCMLLFINEISFLKNTEVSCHKQIVRQTGNPAGTPISRSGKTRTVAYFKGGIFEKVTRFRSLDDFSSPRNIHLLVRTRWTR
jgi:hypothetical protein